MKIKEAHRRGFSLTELLVVLAIMLILSLIAVGSYSNFRHGRRLRFAAESVNSAFVTARSAAITSNGTYRVVIQFKDPITGAQSFSYWIDEIYPGSPEQPVIDTPAALQPAKRPKVTTPMSLPTSIVITDVATTTPDGSIPPGDYIATDHYAVIVYFKPTGTSDDAAVYLVDSISPATDPRSYFTTKLYGITAKPKLFADARK